MNPRKMKPYRTAYERDKGFTAWINGLYVFRAVASCLNSKNGKYPDKPMNFGEDSNGNADSIPDAERFAIYALEVNKKFKE